MRPRSPGLFGEVLALCAEAGLASVGGARRRRHEGARERVSSARTRDYDQIAEEILEEADAVDAAEDEQFGDRRGDELPPELATAQGRRKLAATRPSAASTPSASRRHARSPQSRPARRQGSQAPARRGAVDRAARQRRLRGLPRARGDAATVARFGSPPSPTRRRTDPVGQDQRQRPDSTQRQDAARLHAGLQRPGGLQRAPDRRRRRGLQPARPTSATSNR